MRTAILDATALALRALTHPRFLRSERAYQGRIYCALQEELDRRGVLQDGIILEMEYQKSARHGLTQRPDIILHAPAEETGAAVFREQCCGVRSQAERIPTTGGRGLREARRDVRWAAVRVGDLY